MGGHRDGGGHTLTTATQIHPPRRDTDTTSQSLIGAGQATSLTPQHTALTPLPKTAHRKLGGVGLGTTPQQHKGTAKAHSKALALLLWWAQRGWGRGQGEQEGLERDQRRGLDAPAQVLKGKAPESLLGGKGQPPASPPQQAQRLWKGNRAGGAQSGEGGLLGAL